MDRDEYVKMLKSQIDQWNAQLAKWEAMSEEVKNKYLQELDEAQVRRDDALAELKRIQGASAQAWGEMMGGAQNAFKEIGAAFERARKAFDKK
jgi:lipid II:glycine glycyltransferase (peptidoglycan interpeptide bridge formation enzyme)